MTGQPTGALPRHVPLLPYGRQWIEEDDIEAVVAVLRSDWLTCGPKIPEFEGVMADLVGAREAVAVSSGTAALHAAMYALAVGPGDEVILPPMTFAATANCAVFQGAIPVFVDVEPDTLLIDPDAVEAKITPRTRAIIAVDYAGQPCRYDELKAIADRYELAVVADACHALGASYRERPVGSLADLSIFSFHPVKHIATGEGGMVTTDNPEFARRLRLFRNHGITTDHRQREAAGSWFYEMVDLGYNYRITDLQCALGINQLGKLSGWRRRRQQIARQYDEALATMPGIRPLAVRPDAAHAYHLYVIRIDPSVVVGGRRQVFAGMRAAGIGVNVHYIPVHLHPFYRQRFGTGLGLCPRAEEAYEEILSLPIFPRMTDEDVQRVLTVLSSVIRASNYSDQGGERSNAIPA
ncbi:MAG TPA: UDP-4-amino-4,6-dideoxy-N-acetyl-beta-L-altrosamine transaminase [Gemmataceae bacterium]|jgi:perosamine synthetase